MHSLALRSSAALLASRATESGAAVEQQGGHQERADTSLAARAPGEERNAGSSWRRIMTAAGRLAARQTVPVPSPPDQTADERRWPARAPPQPHGGTPRICTRGRLFPARSARPVMTPVSPTSPRSAWVAELFVRRRSLRRRLLPLSSRSRNISGSLRPVCRRRQGGVR